MIRYAIALFVCALLLTNPARGEHADAPGDTPFRADRGVKVQVEKGTKALLLQMRVPTGGGGYYYRGPAFQPQDFAVKYDAARGTFTLERADLREEAWKLLNASKDLSSACRNEVRNAIYGKPVLDAPGLPRTADIQFTEGTALVYLPTGAPNQVTVRLPQGSDLIDDRVIQLKGR